MTSNSKFSLGHLPGSPPLLIPNLAGDRSVKLLKFDSSLSCSVPALIANFRFEQCTSQIGCGPCDPSKSELSNNIYKLEMRVRRLVYLAIGKWKSEVESLLSGLGSSEGGRKKRKMKKKVNYWSTKD